MYLDSLNGMDSSLLPHLVNSFPHAVTSSAPFIETVEPLHVSMLGNSAVTIKGMYLGSSIHMPYITVGDKPCLEVQPISSKKAICKTPPGFAGPHPVQLSVAGRTTEGCLCNDRSKRCVTYHRECANPSHPQTSDTFPSL